MTKLHIVVILLLAVLVGGCRPGGQQAASNPLVGTWENVFTKATFRPDGTFELIGMGDYWGGTYEVIANRLIVHYTEVVGRPAPPGETFVWSIQDGRLTLEASTYTMNLMNEATWNARMGSP